MAVGRRKDCLPPAVLLLVNELSPSTAWLQRPRKDPEGGWRGQAPPRAGAKLWAERQGLASWFLTVLVARCMGPPPTRDWARAAGKSVGKGASPPGETREAEHPPAPQDHCRFTF